MKRKIAHVALPIAAMMFSAATVHAEPLDPTHAIPSVREIESPRDKALFTRVKAGSLDVTLEKTTLADVAKAFGGKIKHQGDAGDSTYWLCFAGPHTSGTPSLFWFVSGEMGGTDHGILTVAFEPNRGSKVPEGCAAAPAGLTQIDFGIPGIGATVSSVTAKFGAAKPDQHGNFIYAASYPSSELKDFTVTQSLVYTARDDKIIGVAVMQVTTN